MYWMVSYSAFVASTPVRLQHVATAHGERRCIHSSVSRPPDPPALFCPAPQCCPSASKRRAWGWSPPCSENYVFSFPWHALQEHAAFWFLPSFPRLISQDSLHESFMSVKLECSSFPEPTLWVPTRVPLPRLSHDPGKHFIYSQLMFCNTNVTAILSFLTIIPFILTR